MRFNTTINTLHNKYGYKEGDENLKNTGYSWTIIQIFRFSQNKLKDPLGLLGGIFSFSYAFITKDHRLGQQ